MNNIVAISTLILSVLVYSNILPIVMFCVRSSFTSFHHRDMSELQQICQIAGLHILTERCFPLSLIQRHVLLYHARKYTKTQTNVFEHVQSINSIIGTFSVYDERYLTRIVIKTTQQQQQQQAEYMHILIIIV